MDNVTSQEVGTIEGKYYLTKPTEYQWTSRYNKDLGTYEVTLRLSTPLSLVQDTKPMTLLELSKALSQEEPALLLLTKT